MKIWLFQLENKVKIDLDSWLEPSMMDSKLCWVSLMTIRGKMTFIRKRWDFTQILKSHFQQVWIYSWTQNKIPKYWNSSRLCKNIQFLKLYRKIKELLTFIFSFKLASRVWNQIFMIKSMKRFWCVKLLWIFLIPFFSFIQKLNLIDL